MLPIVLLFLPLMLLLAFLAGVLMFIDVAFYEHGHPQHREKQSGSQHAVQLNRQKLLTTKHDYCEKRGGSRHGVAR